MLPYEQWRAQTSKVIFRFLHENGVYYYAALGKDGLPKRRPLTLERCGMYVDDAYDAAELNPRWGLNREEVAVNHLGTAWVESRLDQLCINYNANGTLDFGMEQVNSCNWCQVGPDVPLWRPFCKKEGLNPKEIKLLLTSVKVNMRFAAFWNEWTMRHHGEYYHFAKTKNDWKLYLRLHHILEAK